MSTADLRRELVFGVGAFFSVLVFALGGAFVILGLSTGVQNVGPEGYLTDTQETVLVAGGGLLALAGLVVRVFAEELSADRVSLVRRIGGVALVVGSWAAVFGFAPQSTASGPYLMTPTDKVVLFVIAYAMLIGGYLMFQRVRRAVGI